jgi:AAA family ATP:ADP antiporter
MRTLLKFWRQIFDVRPGERLRTALMALHLSLVLFAYYIVKSVSRALFVNRFDIEKLPYLVLLIAVVGGLLAYLYTKLAVAVSLRSAASWTMGISVPSLVAFWALLGRDIPWGYYAFNVWVSLFSIVLVTQAWLIASNVFNSREAKRVYGLLGFAAVLGAFLGSLFTKLTARALGPRNLLLASAAVAFLAWVPFRVLAGLKGVSLGAARGAQQEETQLHLKDILGAIARYRHLQVIMAIITLMLAVDVLVEFQFSYVAKQTFPDVRDLTSFWASFNLYLNVLTMALQLFGTALLVETAGVGGTLAVMPAAMGAAAAAILAAPNIVTATLAGLAEKTSRYSFNRTGLELLYLPLPVELRNRTKAFVDIFVDRAGRGLAGALLVALGWAGIQHPRQISVLVLALCLLWGLLAVRAKREYIATVRKRLELRRLDLESARVVLSDPATLALLERTAVGGTARQVGYALSLLAEAPAYDSRPLWNKLARSESPEVRAKVYERARTAGYAGLLEAAWKELGSSGAAGESAARAAAAYVTALQPEDAARRLLEHPCTAVVEAALEALAEKSPASVPVDWVANNSSSPDPARRRLAAFAAGLAGDQGAEILERLLTDPDPGVVSAALRAAGLAKNRMHLPRIVACLAVARLRGAALAALVAYGARIAGTLGDWLEDESVAVPIRRQIPRVLGRVADQRSVDVLLRSIAAPELSIRMAVLKALNRLRETAPHLDYGAAFVTRQIFEEARHYCELHAALQPLRAAARPRSAVSLLARSIEERLTQTVERLFRLLGLRYPPQEIYSAYLALRRRRPEALSAALEFLDNVLDRELKRALLPLLDSPARLGDHGRQIFGIEPRTAESAIQELIGSNDPWLAACAVAAAGELRLRHLVPALELAARSGSGDVAPVARAALAALA